jgi:hypothetical protein
LLIAWCDRSKVIEDGGPFVIRVNADEFAPELHARDGEQQVTKARLIEALERQLVAVRVGAADWRAGLLAAAALF